MDGFNKFLKIKIHVMKLISRTLQSSSAILQKTGKIIHLRHNSPFIFFGERHVRQSIINPLGDDRQDLCPFTMFEVEQTFSWTRLSQYTCLVLAVFLVKHVLVIMGFSLFPPCCLYLLNRSCLPSNFFLSKYDAESIVSDDLTYEEKLDTFTSLVTQECQEN